MKLFVMLGAAALLLLVTGPADSISLQVDPPGQSVTLGATVELAVVISGLGNGAAPSLSTFDLDISFDASILSFLGFTFGDPILGDQLDPSGGGTASSVSLSAGNVNLVEVSFDSAADLDTMQADTFALGTLAFTAVSGGVSSVGISVNVLGDAAAQPLQAEIQNGRVEVLTAAVPAAASLLLLLAGVVAGAVFRTRARDRLPYRRPCPRC